MLWAPETLNTCKTYNVIFPKHYSIHKDANTLELMRFRYDLQESRFLCNIKWFHRSPTSNSVEHWEISIKQWGMCLFVLRSIALVLNFEIHRFGTKFHFLELSHQWNRVLLPYREKYHVISCMYDDSHESSPWASRWVGSSPARRHMGAHILRPFRVRGRC